MVGMSSMPHSIPLDGVIAPRLLEPPHKTGREDFPGSGLSSAASTDSGVPRVIYLNVDEVSDALLWLRIRGIVVTI